MRLAAIGLAALVFQIILLAGPATAAPGDVVADVVIPDQYPSNISPSVAFDGGGWLYYLGYGTPVLHRILVPPAGGVTPGQADTAIPITGASGIMSIAYDKGRGVFWAVGNDGLSIYDLSPRGDARLAFRVDPLVDRPGFQTGPYAAEVKIAYDAWDNSIWYSPDATTRIYHYGLSPDADGTARLLGYIDVGLPPNDMNAQCGYSQSSGIATGGPNLFITVSGCSKLFEYTKTGQKVGWLDYNTYGGGSPQDAECDDLSYGVPVIWIRDAWDGHIRAFELPAGACSYGGGPYPPVQPPSTFAQVGTVQASSFPIHSYSHPVAIPAVADLDAGAGDLLLCIFTSHAYATVTTPSGWTLLGTTLNGTAVRTSRYARRADGTESGTKVDFQTSVMEPAVAHVYRIVGWFDDGDLTHAVADAAVTGTGLRPDPPALDPPAWDVESTLWIAAYGAENLGMTSSYPSGYTAGHYDESGGVVGRVSTASARRENATAGEDPAAFQDEADQAWVGVTIAIRPKAGP